MKETKAYVFPVPGRDADIKALRNLVEAGGCLVICPNAAATAFTDCVSKADTVVVLICPQTAGDELIEPVVTLASRLGKRVVGVWAVDAEPNRIPASLKRLADATVRMEGDEIAASVCGGKSIWNTPTGGPRPKQKTPRHKGH